MFATRTGELESDIVWWVGESKGEVVQWMVEQNMENGILDASIYVIAIVLFNDGICGVSKHHLYSSFALSASYQTLLKVRLSDPWSGEVCILFGQCWFNPDIAGRSRTLPIRVTINLPEEI